MQLTKWCKKYGIPMNIAMELILPESVEIPKADHSEASIQAYIRLNASKKGMRLWRNNVGACYTEDGSFLRYGLANDSTRMNEKLKSSDLIGINPVIITPEMVGEKRGQFISREVKAGNWTYRGTEREEAQASWNLLINSLGGDAGFTNTNDGGL